MIQSCLQLLVLLPLVSSFSIYRPGNNERRMLLRSTEVETTEENYGIESAEMIPDDSLHPPTPWVLDIGSITSSSNYPWTVEALAASAPLLRNEDELVLLFVESSVNLLYSGGPLGRGVALWFANSTAQQLQDEELKVVSTNPSIASVSPAMFLCDIEALGPRTSLPFPGENSLNVQAYMDLQSEIQELRNILKPPRRQVSQNSRKGVSRKQRTKIQKRTIKLETKYEVAKQRQGYNVTTDAAILRQRLEECGDCQVSSITAGMSQIKSILEQQDGDENSAQLKIDHYRPIHGASLSEQVLTVTRRSNIPTRLRMVVLSDTHGYESQFLKYANDKSGSFAKLPDADVLIHCGDFFAPGRHLDAFFAAQTHIPTHIVVRGNHDPQQYSFSTAQYITKRQTVTLEDGTIFEARPFLRSRSPQATLPENCDVLMTHEPPFGICDQTYRKERVGSLTLRHAVESSDVPPALWLCGHIHEGRGAVWHSFSSSASTVVVNAANANSGKARRVVTGPVVIDLVPKQ